ncbi:MAG: restriction endonuclease subunit S [Deltaproteobacteria bacterium]|nr:restriction endonuclease subunit S [Deltaproteobacteria bacterium]
MEPDFPVVKLGDVAEVRSGFAFKSSDMGAAGVPLIKIKDITPPTVDVQDIERVPEEVLKSISRAERYKLEHRDILIAMTGATVGKVGRFPKTEESFYLNQRVGKVYLKDIRAADYDFIYYVLAQPHYVEQMFGLADGSAQANISGFQIERLEIPLPSLGEQRTIAHILGILDDKIELNRRMNETLEAIAQAFFKSWFVDFNPVRAKCRGEACLAPTMPKSIVDLFPDSFEDSELGEIPKGWRVRKLSDVTLQITKGTTPTQEDISGAPVTDTHVNYLRVNAISEYGSFLYDKLTTIPESVHKGALKRSILQANDVVYTIAGTIGRIAVIGHDLLPANTNQAVAIIRPKSEVSPAFLVFAMRQQAFQEELHSKIVHAVQANLSLGMISEAKIIFPPEAQFAKILNPIEEIVKKITASRAQSRTLAALRDALLPKLISGELRVKDADRIFARSA